MKKLFSIILLTLIFLNPPVFSESLFKEFYKEYTFKCGPARTGGRLVFSAKDPKSFNPVVSQESTTNRITSYIFEGLTRIDPLTLEVVPELAERWETKDGKEWVFYLRRDVKWNDGAKFTADDVVFTFNDIIYNETIPTSTRDILTIEDKKIRVEKIDDYAVRFVLPETFAPFLRAVGTDILPKHVYASLVTQNKFVFSLGLDSKPSDIVGTGAFRLKEYLPGERVVLERNPFYYLKDDCGRQLPYIDEIVFIILANDDAALLRFIDGELADYGMRAQDIAILGPLRHKLNFSLYNPGPAFSSQFLVFNQNSGSNPSTKKPFVAPYKLAWFRDKRFRQAVAYAINYQKIVDIVYKGLGTAVYSPLSPSNVQFYSDNVKKYSYDPQQAKAMLLEMGFSDKDKDGILEDSFGNKLEINFFTNADNLERIQIATVIKKDLEALGMKIYFLPLDFNNLVRKMSATLDWELMLIGLSGGGLDPHFGKNVWSYKGNLHFWNKSGKPQDPYEQEIEDIFNTAAKTLNEQKRKALYARWQRIVSEELPFIYTPIPYSLYAVRNIFGNMYPTVLGGPFPDIRRLYIKEIGQTP